MLEKIIWELGERDLNTYQCIKLSVEVLFCNNFVKLRVTQEYLKINNKDICITRNIFLKICIAYMLKLKFLQGETILIYLSFNYIFKFILKKKRNCI